MNSLFVWAYGSRVVGGKTGYKSILKALTNSSMIAIYIGLIIYFTQLKLPSMLTQTITQIGNCNTPVAMLVSGSTIARSRFADELKDKRFYAALFYKLIFQGLLTIPIIMLCRVDGVAALCCYIAAATPVAAIVNIFTVEEGKNYSRSSALFAASTLLFLLTLPLMISIYSLIF